MADIAFRPADGQVVRQVVRIAVGNTNSTVIRFIVPRFHRGVDMSELVYTINYEDPLGNKYTAEPMEAMRVTVDDVTLRWLVSGTAASAEGVTTFQLAACDGETVVWTSDTGVIEVSAAQQGGASIATADVVQAQLNAYKREMAAILTEIRGLVGSLDTDVDSLIDDLNSTDGGVTELGNGLTSAVARIRSLEGRATAGEADIDTLEGGLAETNVRVSGNGAGSTGLETRVTAAEEALTALQTDTAARLQSMASTMTVIESYGSTLMEVEELTPVENCGFAVYGSGGTAYTPTVKRTGAVCTLEGMLVPTGVTTMDTTKVVVLVLPSWAVPQRHVDIVQQGPDKAVFWMRICGTGEDAGKIQISRMRDGGNYMATTANTGQIPLTASWIAASTDEFDDDIASAEDALTELVEGRTLYGTYNSGALTMTYGTT